jgi:hypothetical protein
MLAISSIALTLSGVVTEAPVVEPLTRLKGVVLMLALPP